MSTAKIISEVIAIISGNKEEWGRFTVEHAGYTFHIYYDAAFDQAEVEQITYDYAHEREAVLDGVPGWFKEDVFKSVVFEVMKLRKEEIKAEKEAEEIDRIITRKMVEKRHVSSESVK